MPSASPEPRPQFSANLHVVRPGDPAGAEIPPSAPAPIEPVTGGPGLAIAWNVFRIVVWAAVAVWVYPRLLDRVGGHEIALWIQHTGWARFLAAPPLALMALLSVFEPVDNTKQRAALDALATRTGGTVIETRSFDPSLGLAAGPGLRLPVGRWSASVSTWLREGKSHTVAAVALEGASGFSFLARGAASEPALLRGLEQTVISASMKQLAAKADDPQVASAAAALSYLGEPPIAIGVAALDRAVVLRANQPDAARALLASDSVSSAIAALEPRLRAWDWSLYPGRREGSAELRFECRGRLDDEESLRLVQALLRAGLEHLESAGHIARG